MKYTGDTKQLQKIIDGIIDFLEEPVNFAPISLSRLTAGTGSVPSALGPTFSR